MLGWWVASVVGLDNGLALSPPMGWRSWVRVHISMGVSLKCCVLQNTFGHLIDQDTMERVMDALIDRSRVVDGVPTSLADLGFVNVGLDDGWQACGAACSRAVRARAAKV